MRSRRQFLSATFSAATGFGVSAALSSLGSRLAAGDTAKATMLRPTRDETTGLPLLRLPEGFRYISHGWTGDVMSDGQKTPAAHDGMGIINVAGDVVTMMRNHELSTDGTPLVGNGIKPWDDNATGGCTSLTFDVRKGEWRDSKVAMAGTSRNCAGGITPWGTWLTCEETVLGPQDADRYRKVARRDFRKEHGWIFEVPASGVGNPVPLKAMGRFVHEAVAIDHNTGIVYETEDRKTAGFYRFLPHQPGQLAAGGVLQIAEVVGQPDLRGAVAAGAVFDVKWHTIDQPELASTLDVSGNKPPDELGVFKQGKARGGTTFSRLEGCWFGNDAVYFDATSGGAAKAGQIWKYDPSNEKLTLVFESPAKEQLNMPDNLCVNPHGGLILCEDNDYGAEDYPQRVFALNQDGKLTLVAQNNVELNGERNGLKGDFRDKEWAGAMFSPDGNWMFINIQTPGITFAITGPWDSVL